MNITLKPNSRKATLMKIQQIQVGDYIIFQNVLGIFVENQRNYKEHNRYNVYGNDVTIDGYDNFKYIQKWAKSQTVKPDIMQIAKELERYLEELNNPKELIIHGYKIFTRSITTRITNQDIDSNLTPWDPINSDYCYNNDLFEWLKTQGLGKYTTVKEVATKVTSYFEEPRTVNGFRISLCDVKNSVVVTTPRGVVYGIGPRYLSGDVQYKVIGHLSYLFKNKGVATIPEVAEEIANYKEPREWHWVNNSIHVHESGDWKIYAGSTKYILTNEVSGHLSFHNTLQDAQKAAE